MLMVCGACEERTHSCPGDWCVERGSVASPFLLEAEMVAGRFKRILVLRAKR
jgi:hypothetical protein